MKTENKYLNDLSRRRAEKSIGANVIFGQTLGWALSLHGAFNYFILYDNHAFFELLAGHTLLFLGLAVPQCLDLPRKLIRACGEFLASLVFRLFLLTAYLLIIFPLGFLMQKLKGQAPFYYWHGDSTLAFEGWVPKVSSDEEKLVANSNGIASKAGLQLFKHFLSSSNLLIMPGLLVILLLGLVSILLQSTVVAPMIYTLF